MGAHCSWYSCGAVVILKASVSTAIAVLSDTDHFQHDISFLDNLYIILLYCT